MIEEQIGEDNTIQGFFVNIYECGAIWHAASVSKARMSRLGSRMDHLTQFMNLNGRFEFGNLGETAE